MPEQQREFSVSENNKGLWCPFKPIFCQEDRLDCSRCLIYIDWQKLGEIIVICAWCGKVKSRKPNRGQPVVSHGICLECKQKYFGVKAEGETMSRHK